MAALIPPILASAFERMGAGNKSLDQIAINTGQTAASVSIGGDLYQKMDELVNALKSGGSGSGKVSAKEALVLRITAGALKPIGLGLGVIIDALDRAPDGKELKLKMEALTNGLLSLADVGYSILKFAATMILATPLLLIAGVGALVWVPMLKLMISGLLWATEKLDKKALKKILVLGDVGKSLLIMSASLVLMSLLAPQILKGMLVAGAILLGFGLIAMLLDKMKIGKSLNKMSKTLKHLSIALLGLSVGLILMGLLTEPILYGLATASLVVLTLAGMFWLIDKMQIDKSMRKISRSLIMASGAILSVAVSLVLSSLIISSLGWAEVGKVLLLVGTVALTFFVVNKVMRKGGNKGAVALIFAAGAILAVSVAIFLARLLIGPVDAENIMETFGVLVVIGAVAAVFALAGVGEKFIKKGSIAMMFAGGAMIVIALGVYAMKKAIDGISWGDLGKIAAIIVGLALVMGIAGAGPLPGFIALGSAAMIVAGIALITIGAGVNVFNNAIKDLSWENVGMMAAIIGGLALVMGIAGAGPLPAFIALGSAAMMVAGIALIPIGAGVAVMSKAVENLTMDKVAIIGASIGGLALVMGAAGLASPLILLGSAAMLVAGVALIAIAGGVTILSALPAKIFAKGGLFADSGQTGFFGGAKSNFEVMMDAIADGVSVNPFTAAGMLLGGAAFIAAGIALLTIGAGISEFQKIAEKADLKKLNTNVNLIVSSLAETFGQVGKKYPGGAAGLFSGGSLVSQGIDATSGMGRALTGIARGMQSMANLQFPTKFDKEGNPIEFESMDSDAPARVAVNAGIITGVLADVFGKIGKKYPGGKASLFTAIFGGGKKSPVADGISSVMGMGDALTGIALGVQAMADLKFPTAYDKDGKPTAFESVNISDKIKDVTKNVDLILLGENGQGGLVGTFSNVGKKNGPDRGLFTSSAYEKGVEMIQNVGNPLLSLAKAVQMMAELKFPTGFDKDGNPTGFVKADNVKEKLKDVENNIELILLGADGNSGLVGIFKKLGGKDDSGWFSESTIEDGARIAGMIADPIESIASAASKLAEGNWDAVDASSKIKTLIGALTSGNDVDPKLLNYKKLLWNSAGNAYKHIGKSIPSIISAINSIKIKQSEAFKSLFIGTIDPKDPNSSYNTQKLMWNSIGHAMPKIGNSMEITSEAINSMDLAKLTEARTMFEALAVLSDGGQPSDILAQMGESLEEAMQNLADILQDFKNAAGEAGQQSTGAMEKVVDAVSKIKGNSGGSSSSTPQIQFPSKMVVSLDRKSIDAIKEDGMGGGRG